MPVNYRTVKYKRRLLILERLRRKVKLWRDQNLTGFARELNSAVSIASESLARMRKYELELHELRQTLKQLSEKYHQQIKEIAECERL